MATAVAEVGGRPGGGYLRGDHVCCTYADDALRRVVLSNFFADGIAAGERLVYVASDSGGCARTDLRALGLPVDRLMRERRLVVASARDVSATGGRFDADVYTDAVRAHVADALREGFTGLRVASDGTALLSQPRAVGEWLAFELRADAAALETPLVALCTYDTRYCCSERLQVLRAVHTCELQHGSASEPMFRLRCTGGRHVFTGELDFSVADGVAALLERAAADRGGLELELSGVEFVDVAVMRAFAGIARSAPRGATLLGASEDFRRVWSLLGLDHGQDVRFETTNGGRR